MVTVLAHAGGWDEVLIVAIPLLVYVFLRLRDSGDHEDSIPMTHEDLTAAQGDVDGNRPPQEHGTGASNE